MAEGTFAWLGTYRPPAKLSADDAAAELARIREEQGRLTAESVIDAARPKEAPLHPAFEWDNKQAADNYRKEQARRLIRAVVRVETPITPEHREYVLVRSDDAESAETPTEYRPMTLVVQNADLLTDAIIRLEGRVAEARRSVEELQSLAKSVSASDERMARIMMATSALETAAVAVAALR